MKIVLKWVGIYKMQTQHKYPGSHPVRKGKQGQHSHCSDETDKFIGVDLQSPTLVRERNLYQCEDQQSVVPQAQINASFAQSNVDNRPGNNSIVPSCPQLETSLSSIASSQGATRRHKKQNARVQRGTRQHHTADKICKQLVEQAVKASPPVRLQLDKGACGITELAAAIVNKVDRDSAIKLVDSLPQFERLFVCVCGQNSYGLHDCDHIEQLKCIYNRMVADEELGRDPETVLIKTSQGPREYHTTKRELARPTMTPRNSVCSGISVNNRFDPLLVENNEPGFVGKDLDLPGFKLKVGDKLNVTLTSPGKIESRRSSAGTSVSSSHTDGESLSVFGCNEKRTMEIRKKPNFLKRLFTKDSRYDPNLMVNHEIGDLRKSFDQSKMANETIPDEMIISELFNYLTRNRFESYPDHKTKLGHLTKLASKWEATKFSPKMMSQLKPVDLACYWATIGKVANARDVEFLTTEANPDHSRNRLKIWWRRKFGSVNFH